MGFLAPLYIAGILAVGLPILFHLIRRHPQGKQAFSSLMFLSPSPPRLTKRSRLSNLLLLILRAAAVLLLAFAFARPFMNSLLAEDKSDATGRRIALLVDQSASMRRADLWNQAKQKAEDFLKTVKPQDQVALYVFDDKVHELFGFDQWKKTEPSDRVKLLQLQLDSVQPTWAGTRLGDALAEVADRLSETGSVTPAAENSPGLIELISDLQSGSRAQALQGHQWPAGVAVKVDAVALADKPNLKTNASLEWVRQTGEDEDSPDQRFRVKVSNQPGGSRDQFTLLWADANGPLPDQQTVPVYVPAGHSEIVRVNWPASVATRPAAATTAATPASHPQTSPATAPATLPAAPMAAALRTADRLVLSGDDFDFDNTLFLVPPRLDRFSILYLGNDAANNVEGMQYYLNTALRDNPRREVAVVVRDAAHPPVAADFSAVRLVVVTDEPAQETLSLLGNYLNSGGNVLWVLPDAQAAVGLSKVMGIDGVEAREATGEFALIGDVDTQHPLFAPFADAAYGDFTKIHFWHHRIVELPGAANSGSASPDAAAANVHVLARFDDQSPFVLEKAIGKGSLRVLTSGWNPADSQFALSTKFVPLMEGFLKRRDEVTVASQYTVHEAIALPPAVGAGENGAAARTLQLPDAKRIDLPAVATSFDATEKPGIYHLLVNGQDVPLAVNLPPEESQTQAMDPDELAQFGAVLGSPAKAAAEKQAERHRVAEDLENHQKLWRWIILCVLGLLGVETLLAGRLARRSLNQEAIT